MKRVFLAASAFVLCANAYAAQWFQATDMGSETACSDKTVIPELHDMALHDPSNPYALALASKGGCSVVLAKFKVVKRETLQLPAGPQKIVEIAIPDLVGSGEMITAGWMMESDIEPAKSP